MREMCAGPEKETPFKENWLDGMGPLLLWLMQGMEVGGLGFVVLGSQHVD